MDEDAEIRGEAMIGLAKRHDERALPAVFQELTGEFYGSWCLEAARLLAEPLLVSPLHLLQESIPEEDQLKFADDFNEALAACEGRA